MRCGSAVLLFFAHLYISYTFSARMYRMLLMRKQLEQKQLEKVRA